jgi:ABC-type polysaccharide/polyol phosphate export permease
MINAMKQIYQFRALLWALVTRHLAIRYRGSVLGFFWSLLNPLLLMLVYSLVFKYYIRLQGVEHYSVFMFTGLLPWLWLTSSLNESTSSIVGSGHLVTKSMFPAQILPLVPVVTNCINLLLSLPVLFVFMWVSGVAFHWTLLLLPILILVQFLTLQGIGVLLGSLNVFYRDIQHILGNALTFVFFLCPILYTPETVPPQFKFSLDYNPLAQFTMGYHDLILDGVIPSLFSICFMIGFMILSLIIGYWVYGKKHETLSELL